MIHTRSILLLAAFAVLLTACGRPNAKVVIKVVDESGQAVPAAEASVTFERPYGVNEPARMETIRGGTDSNGLFVAKARTSGYVGWSASKPGYYRFLGAPIQLRPGGAMRWRPWGQTNVAVLKRIINPIPMLGAGGNLGLPALGQPCGYDLMMRDWVAPHGKGATADLIFEGHFEQRAKDDFDYRLTVRFSNPKDGLIPFELPLSFGSRLRSAHQAPEDGYLPEWVQTRSQRPGQPQQNSQSETRNYYIRVRSKVDEQGRLQSAHYGKIYGDFLQFSSYLNPTPNDRNLEYAPPEDNGISPL